MNQTIHITTTNGDTYTREGDSFDELVRDAVMEFPYGDITGITSQTNAPLEWPFNPGRQWNSPDEVRDEVEKHFPPDQQYAAMMTIIETNCHYEEFGFAGEVLQQIGDMTCPRPTP